jgi:hypothetical protein
VLGFSAPSLTLIKVGAINNKKGMKMKNVFFFESMITPKIITFIYWLLLLAAVVSGISTMFSGYGGLTFTTFMSGLLIVACGALGARIWCELMIVLFKINANLQQISDKPEA